MAFLFDTKEEQEERQGSRTKRSTAALGRAVGTDTEIALGTRSLLGIFFGLVLICSIFFGLGYSVGRAGGSRAAAQPPDVAPAPDSHLSKPSAEQTLTPVEQPAATTDDNGAPTTPGDTTAPQHMQIPTPAPSPANTAQAPARTPASSSPPAAAPAPVLTPAAATVASTFMVQVAAVRIQQDAQILVDALGKHGYTAVIRNEPQDQLLHIQLGPFNSRADAVAMRAKLLADGYNAVIK